MPLQLERPGSSVFQETVVRGQILRIWVRNAGLWEEETAGAFKHEFLIKIALAALVNSWNGLEGDAHSGSRTSQDPDCHLPAGGVTG